MKQLLVICYLFVFTLACSNSTNKEASNEAAMDQNKVEEAVSEKGVGEVKEVKLNDPLNTDMIASGKGIYELKCAACHKLSDKRVVGPGWAGITERRTPEWIMNMTLNVEEMLEKDPAAREMLKECLVKMPNQNLSRADARDVLEFMYENDTKE